VKKRFARFWGSTRLFIKRHKWSISLILLATLIIGFFVYDSLTGGTFTPGETPLKKKPVETRVPAPLSGLLTEPERAQRTPLAVVIENHPEARPQSGLNKASLVYETFAEGGITRFLAVFQEEDVADIGPVRSARVYFVEWANSHKAFFAHVGGNSDALDLIQKFKVYDINQFYFGNYFWRDAKRYAPHNVYTTTDKLRAAGQSKSYPVTNAKNQSLIFKKQASEAERPVDFSLKINFNTSFAVTWSYSQKDNNFKRSMLGAKQVDKNTGEQVVAKNILIGFSDFSNGKSRTGEQKVNIRTTGSGSAIMYIDGVKSSGTWKRPSQDSLIRFYDTSGSEVKLNPGTTWIEFVPTGTAVN